MGYFICVYAICKNEAAFADRWMDSMSEADRVVVLDTGSTDGTVEKLRARGAAVTQEVISPWRFDTARNRSLELVPEQADICVCTDLDEVFHPGWRRALEAAWTGQTDQARYRYTWSFTAAGQEGHVFWIEKIHRRQGFRWKHPVHEVIQWTGPGQPRTVWAEGVQVDHHPDPNKSRGQYLPLLELAAAESPEDDRTAHYLGREYMFHQQFHKAIAELSRHLTLPAATWKDERAASMRYIARCHARLGRSGPAQSWFLNAAAEAPHLREPWLELAQHLYEQKDWEGVVWSTSKALSITHRPRSYISEEASWGPLPHDLRSIALYHLGNLPEALEQARLAAALAPEDQRLAKNVALLEKLA